MGTLTPQSIPADIQLMDLVIRGNIDHVRNYFDESVAGHDVAHPTWAHLKVALEQGNRKMARLLVTWGAQPTRQELIDYISVHDNPAANIQTLKLIGLNLTNIDLCVAPQSFNARAKPMAKQKPQSEIELIPPHWDSVLNALASAGAPEAVIAGGALRDLYNGRTPASVDIFVRAPFWTKSFMNKVVAGLYEQTFMQKNDKGTPCEYLRVGKRLGAKITGSFSIGDPLDRTETWQIITTKNTTFHIILLGSDLGDGLRSDHKNGGMRGIHKLLGCFDIGLCQIAYNGKQLIKTAAYEHDAKNKTLSIKNPAMTTMEHIAAVISKYPDYTPNDKLAEIIKNGCVPQRPIPPPPPLPPRIFMR